jgi:AcrR family transcriptional regulator
VTKDQTDAGDAAAMLHLLWGTGTPASRGPKPKLTVAAIVARAIAIADADGLDALSMRRVADELGVGTMSLYTYVPGRSQLVTLMLDAVAREVADSYPPEEIAATWREGLEVIAHRNWESWLHHAWVLEATTPRPILGPGTGRKYDTELRPLEGIGLTDIEMDATLTLVLSHVRGTAQAAVALRREARVSGLTDPEWWAQYGPLLRMVAADTKLPLADRVGPTAGAANSGAFNPARALEFGLARILDGVEALIRER